MKILIEHYSAQSGFAQQLADRIRTIKDTEVTTYNDLLNENPELSNRTLSKSFKNYDVIIPIIAGNYAVNDEISVALDKFSELENKFLLPLIYDDTQWSSVNWIVKNKVFPEDGSPFEELSEKLKANTLKKITTTIEEIIFQKTRKRETPSKIPNGDNVVFISHSHNDADFAELLKLQLEKNGIHGWMDNEKLKIGQDWRIEIDEGITKSIALIVIMSPEAKNSEYVTYEWAFGWGKGIPIFPVMLKQTPLHPRLESLQYLDFTNRVTRPWTKLIESINVLKK